jgi:cyclic lactone autoinducer peptide
MKKVLLFSASVVALIASVIASTASIFWVYQPRTPKSLR